MATGQRMRFIGCMRLGSPPAAVRIHCCIVLNRKQIQAEMAVFLEQGINTPGYQPPQGTGLFADVPITYWAVRWIEQLYSDGITTRCAVDPLRYCRPTRNVQRWLSCCCGQNMGLVIFHRLWMRPALMMCRSHIGRLIGLQSWQQRITTGVTPTAFDPEGFVTRAQMAVFLVRTFVP